MLIGILNSSASPRADIAMNWVCHFSVVKSLCNIHGTGYLMIHHFKGAIIHVTNLVNFICHPLKDGNYSPNIITCSGSS